MNELIITQTPATISANFEDVEAGLKNMMQAYNIEVTEDTIPERKKDVATLRKMKAAIDSKRKEVKKDYEAPLKDFESKVKKLTAIIDGGIKQITDQLDSYEVKRIAQKQEVIRRIYSENIGEYEEFLPLQKIYDPRWNNKSTSEKEITQDIQQARLAVASDITVLKSSCGEYYDECIATYKRCGNNLATAMTRLNDLRTAAERAKEQLQKKRVEVEVEKALLQREEPAQKPKEVEKTWTFRVHSKEDADSVRAYLEMFGMRYEEG